MLGIAPISAAPISALPFTESESYLTSQVSANASIFAVARTSAVATFTVTNSFGHPTIDQANPAEVLLTINSSVATLASIPVTNVSSISTPSDISYGGVSYLERLHIGYDGKELTFSEIPAGSYGQPSFNNEDPIELELDLGEGLTKYFSGKIKRTVHHGENNAELITYTARGVMQLAEEVDIIGDYGDGIPLFALTTAATITVAGTLVSVNVAEIPSLRQAVQTLFNYMGTTLNSYGVPSAVDVSGIPSSIYVNPFGTFRGNFTTALNQLLESASGIKSWYNDILETWEFHNIFEAPIYEVSVSSLYVQEHEYERATENRYTAIRLFSEDTGETKAPYVIGDPIPVPLQERSIVPVWTQAQEDAWQFLYSSKYRSAVGIALATGNPIEFSTEDEGLSAVFRKWVIRFPQGPIQSASNAKLHYQAVNPLYAQNPQENWVSVDAELEYVNRQDELNRRRLPVLKFGEPVLNPYVVVTTRLPVVINGNPYVSGDCVGPQYGLAVSYYAANPVTVGFSVRFPPSGFIGTAYTKFGIAREKIVKVPFTEVTLANAQQRLLAFQDAVLSGSIPVIGNPLPELLNLNSKLSVTHLTRVTGLEDTNAIVTSYDYEFADGGQSTVEITTDLSEFVRENINA